MAAKQMGISISVGEESIKEFIGTAAEMAGVILTDLAPGSTYWATDEKAGYVYDGTAWNALV